MDFLVFLTFIPIFITIAAFPLCALLVGWYTKSRIAAIAVGVLPPLLLLIIVIMNTGSFPVSDSWLRDAMIYYSGLIITGGLAGFFASYHERRKALIAFGCVILFVMIFLSGIR